MLAPAPADREWTLHLHIAGLGAEHPWPICPAARPSTLNISNVEVNDSHLVLRIFYDMVEGIQERHYFVGHAPFFEICENRILMSQRHKFQKAMK